MRPQEPQLPEQEVINAPQTATAFQSSTLKPIIKSKLSKKVLIISICSTLLLGVILLFIGYLITPSTKGSDYLEATTLDYLKNKYHEDFRIVNINYGTKNWNPNDTITASLNSSNDTFYVIAREENDKYVFSDSYYGLFIKNDYDKFLKDTLENLGIEAKAFLYLGGSFTYSDKLTNEIPMAKIYDTDSNARFTIKIYTKSEAEAKKVEQKLPQELVKNKLVSTSYITALKEDTYNQILSVSDIDKIQMSEDTIYVGTDLIIESNLEIRYFHNT